MVAVNEKTGAVSRNTEYYALARHAMFAQPGTQRCHSPLYGPAYRVHHTYPSNITTIALINPDNSVVLYVYNGARTHMAFNIIDAKTQTRLTATMILGDLSTFI
jgi:glucosylceramidase